MWRPLTGLYTHTFHTCVIEGPTTNSQKGYVERTCRSEKFNDYLPCWLPSLSLRKGKAGHTKSYFCLCNRLLYLVFSLHCFYSILKKNNSNIEKILCEYIARWNYLKMKFKFSSDKANHGNKKMIYILRSFLFRFGQFRKNYYK